MNPAGRLAHIFGNIGEKSYYIVSGDGFDLIDAFAGKVGFFRNGKPILVWDDP